MQDGDIGNRLLQMTAFKARADASSEAVQASPPPFARWVSPEAQRCFDTDVLGQGRAFDSLLEARSAYDVQNADRLDLMRSLFATNVSSAELGGVRVDVVTPTDRPARLSPDEPILICLHGGAFAWGAGAGALLEAVPIAAVSGLTVVAVDYRMAPEHRHPAGLEDVIAVFDALVADRSASRIGMYGCSAGAILTAQALAALSRRGSSGPAAAALMHAGGLELDGDLLHLAPTLTGDRPEAGLSRFAHMAYLADANPADPLVFPGEHPEVLAAFPPTLLATSTRDFAASSMATMHRRLLSGGVSAGFILFDGLWHAFHMAGDLPESRELYDRLSEFFHRNLG